MSNVAAIFFVVVAIPLALLVLSAFIVLIVQMIKVIVEIWKPLPNAWRQLMKERPGRAIFVLGYFLVLIYLTFLFSSWLISNIPK